MAAAFQNYGFTFVQAKELCGLMEKALNAWGTDFDTLDKALFDLKVKSIPDEPKKVVN